VSAVGTARAFATATRNDLDEAIDQESTLERVRERYGELIPKRS